MGAATENVKSSKAENNAYNFSHLEFTLPDTEVYEPETGMKLLFYLII